MADTDFIPDEQFQPDQAPAQSGAAPGMGQANFVPDEQFQSDDDKYSSPGQMGKTFVEHALNTATFGASTKAETALNIAKPQDIKGRSDANPGVGVAGDLAGVVGSLAVPGLGEAAAVEGPMAALEEARAGLKAAQEAHVIGDSTETANAVIAARKAVSSAQSGVTTAQNTFRAGDLLNPVQATSKIGKAVTGAAKGVLGVPVEMGSGAAKVLNYAKTMGATALGSGVEGAIYNGLGGTITEDALGEDKNLNGEQLLSHIMGNVGTGFLTGAVLGGGLHLAGTAIPESVNAIRDGITGLKNAVIGTGDADAGLVGSLLPDGETSAGKFKQAFANRMNNLGPEDRQAAAKDISSQLQLIDNNIKSSTGDIYDSVDSDASKAKLNQIEQGPILDSAQSHVNAMDLAVKEMRAKPNLWNQGVADSIDAINDGLKDSLTKPGDLDNATIIDELRNAKKALQKLQPKAFRAGDIGGSSDTVKQLYQGINTDIKNSDIVGDVGARLSSADDVVSTRKSFFQPSSDPDFELKRKDFIKSFFSKGKGPGTYIWDPTKMAASMGKPDSIAKSNALEMLENYYDYQRKIPQHLSDFVENVPNSHMAPEQLSNMIDQSQSTTQAAFEKYSTEAQKANKTGLLDNLAAFGIATGHPHIGLAAEALDFGLNPISKVQKLAQLEQKLGSVTNAVGTGVKAIFSATKAAKPFVGAASKLIGSSLEEHQKESDDLLAKTGSVLDLSNQLADNTKDVYDVAPDHALAIQQAAARAAQFLTSKLPGTVNTNPLDAKYEPSPTEIAKYNRYKVIVQEPNQALKQVVDGVITPETVEALNAVYPNLYSKMKQMISTEAQTQAKNGVMPPNNRRLALSMFLGTPINSNYSYDKVMQNQAVYAAPAPNAQNTPGTAKPSKPGMGKVKVASRASRSLSDDS